MKVAALILAGGQALRMGGMDKGMQLLHGKPLVQHVIERIRSQVDEVWLSVNERQASYHAFGLPLVVDECRFEGLGPLVGIASYSSVLPESISSVQILACDTPFLPLDLSERLANNAFKNAAYPQTELGAHYSCALVTREVIHLASNCLLNHQHSLREWLIMQAGARPVEGFAENEFININTRVQLCAQEHMLI